MLKWTKQQQQQNQQKFQQNLHIQNKSPTQTQPESFALDKISWQLRNEFSNQKPTQATTSTTANMPTLTQTLQRRLHRRSLDNQLDDIRPARSRYRERHSLTSQANKENFGIHFMRSPCGNTSLTALHDLSNGKSCERLHETPPRGPRRRTLGSFDTPLNIKRSSDAINTTATPLRQAAGRFSDDFADANDETPLSRMRFRQTMRDEVSLSSSRMGDTTLDRMLDAIIESARKDVRCTKHASAVEQPALQATDVMQCDEDFNDSIHEMEVRTPTHLKRQRVVRRKKQQGAVTTTAKLMTKSERSPLTPQIEQAPSIATHVLLAMDTPQHATCVNDDPPNFGKELQRCSTPTLEETQSIKRCLTFSPPSDEEMVDDADYSAAKRSSVASSNASSMGDAPLSPTLGACASQRSSLKMLGGVRGSLDLAIFVEQDLLNVHVIRCRELQRSNGSTALNAYVKVALIGAQQRTNNKCIEHRFQRTAVHRHSSRPYFDHRFQFDLSRLKNGSESNVDASNTAASNTAVSNAAALNSTASNTAAPFYTFTEERLQLAVWHRDRQLKRSEFLGCISFPLQLLLQQSINGSYKLQSQACLKNPQAPVLATNSYATNSNNTATIAATQLAATASITPKTCIMATLARPKNSSSNTNGLTNNNNTNSNNNNDDDTLSIDSMALPPQDPAHIQHIPLSKKAIHQRDADENLFLRFLELDPIVDPTATTTGTSTTTTTTQSTATNANSAAAALVNATTAACSANASSNLTARRSSLGKPVGRTPFTMTKKLTRTVERGFGFSIVWTHPPRVEKIEPGLSADRCGILPGDYVIFVDKHNVVTMPEADVLNLIRSQGTTLTLEIFRRSGSGGGAAVASAYSTTARSTATVASGGTTLLMNGRASRLASAASNGTMADETASVMTSSMPVVGIVGTAATTTRTPSLALAVGSNSVCGGGVGMRPSTACSGTSSIEAAKRRLNLPQVTFSKESIAPITDNRRRFLLQLISREQNFISALHFGMQRFVQPLQERKDLISPNDHRTLFQNIDELLRLSEDILEQLCNDEQEPQMNFASRVYLSKTTAICAAYKKYCNGIKRADCVLVNKSRQAGSEFVAFLTEPQVPRKRPDLTMLIHRPLQHFREILKLMQLLASNCHVDTEEHKNFSSVINELQAAYREITVSSGLMEPLGEGRPLLTLQDLEARMVFTKCKPFTLAVQGRQWIFGGDLSRVEGRSVKPYWTLLFSDIIVFAKVSRDRVLFITEEPIPIANVVDSCFHMRKKTTEFRLTVDPNGRLAESPTGYCAPDLSRTPKKSARRKSLVLRAPSLELKAVWQNLLQRQIFLVNAALGSTPLSSPLDSPDVLNTLVPLSDIGVATTSMGSIKHSSLDSINLKNQQQRNQQRHSLTSQPAGQIELLIDEKCRILNKTGTPKSSALHLANWMKGQLDKQQEQARLAAARSRENLAREDEHLLYSDSDQDERITYWTRQQLEKRTKELNLIKENGHLRAKPDFGGKRLSGVEELSMSDAYSENVSQISQSRSTTSDSQITVRSSPNVLDKLAVCRHCHNHCQQSKSTFKPDNSSTSPPPLICTSLKVQHSQSSPHRCCRLNGNGSQVGSVTSLSSSTVTGEPNSERSSSKLVASASKREACEGDTESDVAPLLTDELSILSQSGATDDGSIFHSSSGTEKDDCRRVNQSERSLTDGFNSLRILDKDSKQQALVNGSSSYVLKDTFGMVNGHVSSGTSSSLSGSGERVKPAPPPRRLQNAQQDSNRGGGEAKKVTTEQQFKSTFDSVKVPNDVIVENTRPKTPKSPKKPQTANSHISSTQFIPCNCECTPADFEHTTLSPDELEQQTCKIIQSPKQSPRMPRTPRLEENPHRYCKCVCGNNSVENSRPKTSKSHESKLRTTVIRNAVENHVDEDDDLSLMLIGLAQFTPATRLLNMSHQKPTAPTKTPPTSPVTRAPATTPADAATSLEVNFVPTIAVVPPTPDAVLTKTTTNIWDNSATPPSSSHQAIQLHINNVPHQPVVEHIQDDSCEDESPLDEEPPYRPMNNALRRYGTMSSLEKLPSDDRMEDGDVDELEDDGDFVDNVQDASLANNVTDDQYIDDELGDMDEFNDDDLEEELKGELEAQFECENNDSSMATLGDYSDQNGDECGGSGGSAWTSRAGSYMAGKMSFFEESRAFIDKYLGRWNQEQVTKTTQNGTEFDEQLDECTSGATSGEDVWGTPTSGGENDEMHLVNSENTHSSPTKSSTSLNDDDDTELMMDELLMAPPMTASTIRGLLPRRRLEPLFEEETESDEEEKTQQESDELKKGTTTTNGHDLADSAGSSSDEDLELDIRTTNGKRRAKQQLDMEQEEEEEEEEEEDDDEEPTSTEERLLPNLPTTTLGPRPLRNPGTGNTLPIAVLRGSSCEYLLEQRSDLQAMNNCNNSSHATSASSVSSSSNDTMTQQQSLTMMQLTMTELETSTSTKTTTTLMSSTMNTTQMLLTKKVTPSSTSTTISNVSDTTSNSSACVSTDSSASMHTTVTTTTAVTTAKLPNIKSSITVASSATAPAQRPAAKFIPPPPPPRRLLLTQTNLKKSGNVPTAEHQQSSGVSADIGSSAAAVAGDAIHRKDSPTQRPLISPTTQGSAQKKQPAAAAAVKAACSTRNSVANNETTTKRPSSTIIETSLLGRVDKEQTSISSTTASTTTQQMSQKTAPTTKKTVANSSTSNSNKVSASSSDVVQPPVGSGLSPRLEMRLALNHDILGDEDLICYDPGPDLTTILGHDLSTFHRLTGRDLLHRSATNRVQPREAVISFSQQRNSKMDTPTVNRRPRPSTNYNSSLAASARVGSSSVGSSIGGCVAPQQSNLQPNRNTWSSSAYAEQRSGVNVNSGVSYKSNIYSSDESKLSDLEILARREKIYCMSQSRSGSPAMTMGTTRGSSFYGQTLQQQHQQQQQQPEQQHLMRTTSITSMGQEIELSTSVGSSGIGHMRKIGRDETAVIEAGKGNRIINFIRRRSSDIPLSPNCSQTSLHDSNSSSTPERRLMPMSPRKDNDKPSLNRRLWKQITKRRRANSVSEIAAS